MIKKMSEELEQPKSLSVLAYETIRQNIVDGIFKPGEWLRQSDLEERLGISATPIRQALERLITEGLLERIPNRGVRVIRVTKEEIAELFAIRLLLAFGLVFEMPIVVLFLTKIGLITPNSMKKFRKFAILCSFILSAILTPPDVATQLMMALPIIILYEISIFLSKTMYREKQGEPDSKEREDGA